MRYKMDVKGNAVEVFYFDDKGIITSKSTNTHNALGDLVEAKSYENGTKLQFIHRYFYDEKNNEIKQTLRNIDYPEEVTTWTFTYEYDQHQNWVKRIEFKDSIPQYIVEREIEYYD